MKKNIIIGIAIFLFIIISTINAYLIIEYNINLLEYFSRSNILTPEEKEWLKEQDTIVYVSTLNNPPLRYVDEESKLSQGSVVDYIQALSIELETEIKFMPMLWNDALESVSKNKTNIIDMFPSESRSKYFLFSDPIYNMRGVILVSKNENDIYSYFSLKGKKVAALRGDYSNEFLNSRVTDIHFMLTNDIKDAITLLEKGKVDAVVGDEPVISYYLESLKLEDNFKILQRPMYENDVVLAVSKSNKMLLNILNKGIYNLGKKKTTVKIQQKWFGISAPLVNEKSKDKAILLIYLFTSLILLISYIFYTLNVVLKREVEKRKEEIYDRTNDLQITFDGLTHSMVVLNMECNIVNINKFFCNLAKLDKAQILGSNCRDFSYIMHVDCENCIIKDTFKSGRNHNNIVDHNNSIYELSTFALQDKLKTTNRVLVMIKDITKIKLSEKHLLHSNKMAAIGQLAAGVAHEIRNPLGLIRNYCYLLKNGIESYDKDIVDKSICVIEASVDRASGIIENLLNFSRLSGSTSSKVNIENLIDGIITLEDKVMKRQNITQQIECDKDLTCDINLESIKHIFINLISNAIDAMPEGGILKVICKMENDSLFITCSDTGIGIQESDLENIFNPFYTTKPQGKGTGLGLYIIYTVIQELKGDIKVKSKLKEGTSFYVTIPLKHEQNSL